jgi:hypothetical protein
MSRSVSILALLAGLVLTGCAPIRSARTCEEISAARLRALIEECTSVDQAAARVTETYGIAAKDLHITRAPDNPDHCDLDWTMNGAQYSMFFLSSGVLGARITYGSSPPTADQIMQCLGVPDWYTAFYGRFPDPLLWSPTGSTQLTFYYPALGVACWGSKLGHGDQVPRLDGSVAIDIFDFEPLGPPDQVLEALVTQGGSRASADWIWRAMKPWPGDWQDVEVQTP